MHTLVWADLRTCEFFERPQDPVDLSLMQARLEAGAYYITLDIFTADVRRMCANARIYNAAHTIYVQYANRVRSPEGCPCASSWSEVSL